MDWCEKVEKLKDHLETSYARIEKRAGWTINTLSVALNRKSMPAADAGLKLARALDVSCEWLFDDAAGWPPPEPASLMPIDLADASQQSVFLKMMSDALSLAAQQLAGSGGPVSQKVGKIPDQKRR